MSASGRSAAQESVALVDLLGEFLNARPVAAPRAPPGRPGVIRAADLCLRGIAQVIFMNQPLCGLLILAGMALQSWMLALFALLGVAASTGWAAFTIDDRGGIDAGIYGYNGALVGAAVATFGQIDSIRAGLLWSLCTMVFAAASSAVLKRLGRWLIRHGVPALTFPFVLCTLACFALVSALGLPGLSLAPASSETVTAVIGPVQWLEGAALIGFGQVFFVGQLAAAVLVVMGVLQASPLGAAIGLTGGLAGLVAGLLVGASADSMAAGLLSYNAILCALALGGVFFAFSLRSLAIGVAAAWVSAILGQLLAALLAPLGLPALTLSFCLVTAAVMMLVRHRLPALIPVSMHAIHSPQEHRRRYAVAVGLLRDFRRNLQAGLSLGGVRRQSLKARADASVVQELDALFARLDRDGDGRLSRVDLAGGLRAFEPVADQTDPWSDAVAAAERRLDMLESIERLLHVLAPESDDQIDATQFAELMLRCRRLLRDRDRLLTYLQPISADPTRPIGRSELDRLLVSLGQSPLEDQEWTAVVRLTGGRLLTWGAVVDLMLIT